MVSLIEQFISFHVALGELPEDAPETDSERAYDIHRTAYNLVDKEYSKLPCYLCVEGPANDPIETPSFELCCNEGLTEVIGGKLTWSMCFFANREISPEVVSQVRDLVVGVYERAAAGTGLSVRFVEAQRYEVFRTSRQSKVDFSAGIGKATWSGASDAELRKVAEAAVVAHGALFALGSESRPDRPALEAIWAEVDALLVAR